MQINPAGRRRVRPAIESRAHRGDAGQISRANPKARQITSGHHRVQADVVQRDALAGRVAFPAGVFQAKLTPHEAPLSWVGARQQFEQVNVRMMPAFIGYDVRDGPQALFVARPDDAVVAPVGEMGECCRRAPKLSLAGSKGRPGFW